jgi:transposase
MEPRSEPTNTVWSFPFTPQDWEQTPPAVQAYVRTLSDEVTQLHDRVETLEARLTQNSTTSSKPPSSDSPYKKPQRHAPSTTPRKAGGKPGHAGHRQVLLPPTAVHDLRPERCPCGNTTFTAMRPYYTHQVLELPPIELEVQHFVLHQGWCTVQTVPPLPLLWWGVRATLPCKPHPNEEPRRETEKAATRALSVRP